MSFATIAAKINTSSFRGRLAVAVTEQCRYILGRSKGAEETEAHYAWEQAAARQVLQDICNTRDLDRMARLVLLPVVWNGFDPDNDEDLQIRVAERFPMFVMNVAPE